MSKKNHLTRKSLEGSLGLLRFFHRGLRDVIELLNDRLLVQHVFESRPDDIFLVTYPKSGTTLMQMMLYQMTTDGNMSFPHITSVSPYFEAELRHGKGRSFEALPSPRFFKTHLYYQKLPRDGRFIYMARNARDVAISAYHHHTLMAGSPDDLERFVSNFLQDQMGFGSWFKHIESWWPHRSNPRVLFLLYDEAIGDLAEMARKIARFCKIPLREEDLPRIVERCSVEFMKQYDRKFDPRLHQTSADVGTFIRKGISGDGRAAFTKEQNQMLARRLEKMARRLGYGDSSVHTLLSPRLELQ